MTTQVRNIGELKHPGFVLFEGIDLVGKSTLAKKTAERVESALGLKVQHNYNQGFISSDIIDEKIFSQMNPGEKAEYFMQCYLQDSLPSNPENFVEIIQDRYAPCIVFYAITRGGLKLEEAKLFIKDCMKPKHIFLVECSYEERVKRANERSALKTLEKISISSKSKHDEFVSLYRQIIEEFRVPFTVIDTTTLTTEESVEECLNKIKNSGILTHEIKLDELLVDFECRVYESTVNLRVEKIKSGKSLNPVKVIRKIDSSGQYINALQDGRHRAYASWKSGLSIVKAYINYELVNKIDPSVLTSVKDFQFRKV
jgi:thymidylate kinase